MLSQSKSKQQRSKEVQIKDPKERDINEEHQIAAPSPAKSSISDIKPGDFYDEEFQE